MIKRLLVTLSLLTALLLPTFAWAGTATAYNPLESACKVNNESSACGGDQSKQVLGANGVIARVTRLVAMVAGVAAVIAIIVYGIMIVTSYGDAGKATAARNGIIASCIGLVVIVLSQTIIVFIVSNV